MSHSARTLLVSRMSSDHLCSGGDWDSEATLTNKFHFKLQGSYMHPTSNCLFHFCFLSKMTASVIWLLKNVNILKEKICTFKLFKTKSFPNMEPNFKPVSVLELCKSQIIKKLSFFFHSDQTSIMISIVLIFFLFYLNSIS